MLCTFTYEDIGPCPKEAIHPEGVSGLHPEPLCSRCLKYVKKDHQCAEEGCTARPRHHGRCRPHQYMPLRRLEPWQLSDIRHELVRHVEPDWETGCWMYAYRPNDKNGRINAPHGIGIWLAHMLAYGLFFEGYPNGSELDHLCNRSLCMSPFHLRPATPRANDKLRSIRAENPAFPWWTDKAGNEIDPPSYPMSLILFSQMNELPMGLQDGELSQAQQRAAQP